MSVFRLYRAATDVLTKSRRPLFVLLKDVDPDALGSAMALARALAQTGARPQAFCAAPIPDSLSFLVDDSVPFHTDPATIDFDQHDCVVIGDTGQIGRTGIAPQLETYRANGGEIINIDHHEVADAFGTINLIDPRAAATTVLVYDLLKLGGWTIDRPIATAILAGIIADTDNFTNAATTIRSLEVAAHCYGKGAEARKVLNELYRRKPLGALQLWGRVLERLTKNHRYGIVSTVILQSDFAEGEVTDEATEGLANFLNSLNDMKAALILKELPDGKLKGSFRTTRDDVDVSRLAQALGGGGHRKAAGFTVDGKIAQTDAGWRIE